MDILNFLEFAKTPFHAVAESAKFLEESGYVLLKENQAFNIEFGKKYYIKRNGSALIAFSVPTKAVKGYKIIASHTDSPCFKVKLGKTLTCGNYAKLPVEQYGGGLRYSWLDRPLVLSGRLCGEIDGKIIEQPYTSQSKYVIPSLAIHYKRNANDGFSVNTETDCSPLFALSSNNTELTNMLSEQFCGKLLDADLFLVCDEKPFLCGESNEFACAPRVDNLTSCFSSLQALVAAEESRYINVAYLADNEEIGSRTKQGAASKFLSDTLFRIYNALNLKQDYYALLDDSFLVSCDNAHATHPNHFELADKSNDVFLGGGVVIKHHANQNYTTDGFSSAVFKNILQKANVKYCDFYMRADLPCGGTLGSISSSQLSIKSIDIGLPQLAMHSAMETFAVSDYDCMVNALIAFFSNDLCI